MNKRLIRWLFLFVAICTLFATVAACGVEVPQEDVTNNTIVEEPIANNIQPKENNIQPEDKDESKKIEEALVEQGYFNNQIPLDYDLQAELRAACDEFDVPFSLMVAMIDKETDFTNMVGDNGNAEGYLQIWEYWCWDKMDDIGATNLMNPVDNFRTGCYIMSLNMENHSVYDSLSIYNTGSSGNSYYADTVMELYDYWSGVLNE